MLILLLLISSPDPTKVSFPGNGSTLGGFLYRPSGNGPFPAVVFNHGSERAAGHKIGQATFFVKHGFILFVPHRRGHGLSPGEFLDPKSNDAALVKGFTEQVDDVEAAVLYLKALPDVDTHRIYMSGCSFGGIMTVLAAEKALGIKAGVDFAGGASKWKKSPLLRQRMISAVQKATFPIFFAQAENDYETTPSEVLALEMEKSKKPFRKKIYPPNGTTPEEGHAFCGGGEDPAWGPDVLDFFK